jgi:hypothetical protein
MRSRIATLFLLLLITTLNAAAQAPGKASSPMDATVCDLMAQPSKYNGQLVRVRGQISIAFEDFSLFDKDCSHMEAKERNWGSGVWLNYGGDEGAPTVYCCGDHSRKKGELIEIEGRTLPLLRDKQMLEFRRRITAQRRTRPDGAICEGRECYFYDVTATVTGHFFAMQETEKGEVIGYGHMGFFHTLFIEQVTDVDARRTAVPAGGVFDCKTEPLKLTPSEAMELVSEHAKAHDQESWSQADRRALLMGAMHWGEPPIDVNDWRKGSWEEEQSYYWNSPDLLKILSFKFPFKNAQAGTSRSEFTSTRTNCTAVVKPLLLSAKTGCDAPYWTEENPESIAKRVQVDVDRGKDLWRLNYQKVAWKAVQEYAAKHAITVSSKLKLVNCEESPPMSVEGDSFASCEWATSDGLQSASISLVRHGTLASANRPKERVVWVPLSGGITTCKAD